MNLSLDIRHSLPGFTLDVQFDAPSGITALFGKSGAGKTSVVNAVAGLLTPDAGRIALDNSVLFDSRQNIALPVHRRQIGYVFQDARLFPHMTVEANLAYGSRWAADRPGPTLAELCGLLDIAHLLARYPRDLSGGETQRVAIGRALMSRPRMLLLDEPLAALDASRKADILPHLERLRDELAVPMLYVSHSVAEVARLATTVVILENGRVAQTGPVGDMLSDLQMVRQIGVREAGAVLPARVVAHHADGLSELSVSGGRLFLPRTALAEGATTRVRILAQDVILASDVPRGLSALNILPAQVTDLRAGDGPGVICQLRCGTDHILARITRRSAEAMGLTPGHDVHAVIKAVSVDPVDVGRG